MSIKNKLQIYLITYNRKQKLDRTFKHKEGIMCAYPHSRHNKKAGNKF